MEKPFLFKDTLFYLKFTRVAPQGQDAVLVKPLGVLVSIFE